MIPNVGFITSRVSNESNKKLHLAPIERENEKYKLPGTNRALSFAGIRGRAVRIMARGLHSGWRRVFSVVLIYALALQGFVFALDMGRPAVAAGSDSAIVGFALCSHHSGADATLPGTPPHDPLGDCNHCPFCLSGALYVSAAPPGAFRYSKVAFSNMTWLLTPPRL